jgi:hypothetical protein
LRNEDFIEGIDVILSKLDNVTHVLFAVKPERFVDPDEHSASSLAFVSQGSFGSKNNKLGRSVMEEKALLLKCLHTLKNVERGWKMILSICFLLLLCKQLIGRKTAEPHNPQN